MSKRSKEYWEGGRYKYEKDVTESSGQIEHFDASLKSKKSDEKGLKDWLWDNLFVSESDTNRRKSTKPVDKILKPDEPSYDPHKLLEFDFTYMVYLPNRKRSAAEQERIEYMIKVLGINFPGQVHTQRKRFLKRVIKKQKAGFFDLSEFEEEGVFPTALEMLAEKLNLS